MSRIRLVIHKVATVLWVGMLALFLSEVAVGQDAADRSQPPPPAADTAGPATWKVSFTPYLWGAGLKGTVGIKGFNSNVDLSFKDIFDHLDIGLMAHLELEKIDRKKIPDIVLKRINSRDPAPIRDGLFIIRRGQSKHMHGHHKNNHNQYWNNNPDF